MTAHYLIPEQQQGTLTDLEHNMLADTIEDAEDLFVDAKERMLDVNNWKRYYAQGDVIFALTDPRGGALNRRARKGDLIKIQSRGHGNRTSDLVIEAIEYDDYPDQSLETFAMRLRPLGFLPAVSNLAGEATSTIVVERRVRKLLASFHGRNEDSALNDDMDDYWLGITERQWQGLVQCFIEP